MKKFCSDARDVAIYAWHNPLKSIRFMIGLTLFVVIAIRYNIAVSHFMFPEPALH